jgi:hypothetical protein
MAIVRLTYLFNVMGFREKIAPLVPGLEEGNFQPLYLLAKQTMEDRPELWFFLDDLILGPPLEEDENDEIASRRLLMMVMAPFVKPVSALGSEENWMFLRTALPLIGWSEHETRLLLGGQSLCRLLLPDKVYDPTPYANDPTKTPWCEGYAGWQDVNLIAELHRKLGQAKEAYFELAQHPEAIQKELPAKAPDGSLQPLEWFSPRLIRGYEGIMQVMEIALGAQSPLAIAIA